MSWAALACGIAIGWAARGILINVVDRMAMRLLSTAIGKEKIVQALAQMAAKP